MSDTSKGNEGYDSAAEARYGRLCEYAFGEMGADERVTFEVELAGDEELQREYAELLATAEGVRQALPAEALPESMRATLSQAAGGAPAPVASWKPNFLFGKQRRGLLQAAAGLLVLFGVAYGIKSMLYQQPLDGPGGLADRDTQGRRDQLAKLDEVRRFKGKDGLSPSVQNSATASHAAADRENDLKLLVKQVEQQPLLADGTGNRNEPSELSALQEQREASRAIADSRLQDLQQSVDLERAAMDDGGERLGIDASPAAPVDSPALESSSLYVQADTAKQQALQALAAADALTPELSASHVGGEFKGAGDTVPPASAALAAGEQVVLGAGAPGPANSGPSAPAVARPSSPAGAVRFDPGRWKTVRNREAAPTPVLEQASAAPSRAAGLSAESEPQLSLGIQLTYSRFQPQEFLSGSPKIAPAPQSDFMFFDDMSLGGELSELGARIVSNPSQTGSSEFFLGRGVREQSEEEQLQSSDDRDGRRALPSRERLQELTERLILDCRVRPQEAPKDMFFRAWGEHPYRLSASEPLSTFGADVDTASYTLARRTLRAGRLPSKEQIRSEEFLNYFRADQPAPEPGQVFGLHLESAPSLFNTDPMVELLRVTVRGQDVMDFERQPMALTLVIDVSGSMNEPNRMPLVKRALALLLTQLSYADNVAIVAFSTQAVVLSELVSAANRSALEEAIFRLNAKGGTNIESGISTGFEIASRGLVEGAVNRVILLSDGVGNIGERDQKRILEKVETFRQKGVYLNTIGVGMGDHNDHFLEQLADRGDGQCQYFDSAREAEKVLVHDLTKTLQPIARDVKIQLEFDPEQVEAYRQIGYENRAIAARDFRNDAVDAGEVNAGHQVTALYEIVRHPGVHSNRPLASVRLRYKLPFVAAASEAQRAEAEKALELSASILPADLQSSHRAASWGFRRAMLAAQFAECLRRSIHARQDSLQILLDEVQALASERNDQELFELKDLIKLAVPMLIDETEHNDMQLLSMLDALRRLHYEQARREQLRGDREPNLELESECARLIQDLEQRIAERLRQRMGYEQEDSSEQLKRIGYVGGDEDDE